jgi:hypothetical protein
MESFKVNAVLDGNTLEVAQAWEIDGKTGKKVVATGYDAPKRGKEAISIEQRLSVMLTDKQVQLGPPYEVQGNKLICNVYFQGMNLADHFSYYKEEAEEPPEEEEETSEEEGEEETLEE